MERVRNFNLNMLLFLGFVSLFGFAFLRTHMRVQTTLIGYKLGKLKTDEAMLLEERSHLQMTLAQITNKNHLSLMAASPEKTTVLEKVASNH